MFSVPAGSGINIGGRLWLTSVVLTSVVGSTSTTCSVAIESIAAEILNAIKERNKTNQIKLNQIEKKRKEKRRKEKKKKYWGRGDTTVVLSESERTTVLVYMYITCILYIVYRLEA